MKAVSIIMKVLAALAAVAGIVYVIATYGDRIVSWAKGLLGICDCDCEECDCLCEDDCDDCKCEGDCDENCPCEAAAEASDEEDALTAEDFEG